MDDPNALEQGKPMSASSGGPDSPWEPLKEISPPPSPQRSSLRQVILRGVLLGLLGSLFLGLLAIAGALGVYAYYAASLPAPQELYKRATPFKSTKIYDRHGRLLFEVFDPLGGRRTLVHYEDIPPTVIKAVVATEDETFFSNPGVNPLAIARALYTDLRYREIVQGGSTITQQLVKNLFLSPERTLSRKIKEAILAAEVTRRYSKEEILEIYLNEVYFGNLAYGVGTAAETYFGKPVSELSLAEAALLAGLIQSPVTYDPYTHPQAALARRNTVLELMHKNGFITRKEMLAAQAEPLHLAPRKITMEAPHMVMYVREQLERLYGTEMLYRGGLQVYTTLDLDLQHLAERIAREKIALLRKRQATNAALVAMDPLTGDVLAMLGSVDFYDKSIDGQVNVALSLRQPGSTLKTFTYLAAMERGWTAATMLMDVEQEFPDGANPPYKPHNYDHKEYGPISLRTALACSRNIPAVSTLYQIGLPALLEVTHRLGIRSLNRMDYGLSLTLGGGEVTLLELTGAYAALANGGHRVTPRTILYITDQEGKVIRPRTTPKLPQVMDPRLAYILTDILSDNQARARAFGYNSPLKLSFPAAVKTGTTDDYHDSWTVGYTPQLVVGVWVGNSDNSPMERVSGARGAGLIWHDFMEQALAGKPHPEFARPPGLVEVEVCALSGQKRSELCPEGRKELFRQENVPEECTVHRKLAVCKLSGKLATEYCPRDQVEEKTFVDLGPQWDDWAREHGFPVPPRESCPIHTGPVHVVLEAPHGPVQGVIQLRGTTEVPNFTYYALEYGRGKDPKKWTRITPQISAPVYDGVLCRWDTSNLRGGTYTVRLLVFSRYGQTYEARARVEVRRHPTATPSPTWTLSPTPTWTPFPSPTASSTPVPSITVQPSPTQKLPSPLPTHTLAPPPPQPRATPEPTRIQTPTEAASPTANPQPTLTNTPTPTALQENKKARNVNSHSGH
ncbi:MAG: penicillin-binding protein 1C [Anaerolineae bacterium]|nr:penicillin-binding protein 1C [Anaerolineae bacterium]